MQNNRHVIMMKICASLGISRLYLQQRLRPTKSWMHVEESKTAPFLHTLQEERAEGAAESKTKASKNRKNTDLMSMVVSCLVFVKLN